MSPGPLDRTRLASFLARAADELRGEWLVIGGAAAATWFLDERVTEDIDLIAVTGDGRLELMELATRAGLPIEAVNSAADFFVRRIAGWREQLVPHVRGSGAVIYRPSATLFLLLKVGRLSAIDLGDCLALLAHAARAAEPVDRPRVIAALAALPATTDQPLAQRRAALTEALGGG